MNAFIYDTFLELMASHAVTLDAERAQHAELCLHRKKKTIEVVSLVN